MTTAKRGRFCDRCKHEVADLTQASDSELLRTFTGPNAPKCARFDARQLDRALLPLPRRSQLLPVAAFTSLLAVLSGCETIVQGEPRPGLGPTDQIPEAHATTGILIPIPTGADSVPSVPPDTGATQQPGELFFIGEIGIPVDTVAHNARTEQPDTGAYMPVVGSVTVDPPAPQQ